MKRLSRNKRWLVLGPMIAAMAMVLAACGSDPTATPIPGSTEPTATPTPAPPGEGISVNPARATWSTGFFQEAVYSRGLEELGYDVADPTTLDAPIFYDSVSRGEVDYWANAWFPLHSQYEQTFSQGARVAGTVAEAGALQGYLVDKAGAEEFGIETLEDFTRDEVKEAYDANGDGKADLVACPPGWGCETVIEHQLDAYSLRDHVNATKSGYTLGMSDAIARYNSGEHIFFYTWTPNWTVNQLVPGEDVVWIEAPSLAHPDESVTEEDVTIEGVAGCGNDPCFMGWPGNDIAVVANSEFLDNNPAAATLFDVIDIPLDDIFRQNNRMFAGEDSQEDIDGHAIEWIALNQEAWDGWIAEAMAAAQ